MNQNTLHRPQSLADLRKAVKPVRNVNKQHKERLGGLEKLAMSITKRIGTMGFFFIIIAWTILWLGWNFLAPKDLRFDPPSGFVLWLFISNMIQIFLMPLIMIAQNVDAHHAELRAESDFEVNVKAEKEVELLLQHLEYQNAVLLALAEKNGLKLEELTNVARPTPADRDTGS
jgi:uncharacterized membrane protein